MSKTEAPGLPKYTEEGDMPQKKYYRSRAHCNPLSHNDAFSYPSRPEDMDWTEHYPIIERALQNNEAVIPSIDFADVGCGFGGLTVALAKLHPDKLTLAMEIRPKVTEYVRLRIHALRNENPGQYENVSVLKSNAMKYLPNFFQKGQLTKMFFCFPDPHFKTKNHRRRIVNTSLLTEYAYCLAPHGLLYTITDVEELFHWHVAKCSAHPYFTRVPDSELEQDPTAIAVRTETEEGKKVERNGGSKFLAVFRRLPDDEVEDVDFWADAQVGSEQD